ncbi:hypothetical protein HDF26_000441 [Pedobacter cryoconitis]|uniref:Lipoprotein n=1 Tax=Pedobacter cryoconitis TaxID=188932 RepID=A0A7W8ZP30_9SPHI|nr:hypothetical protein [Pedobacter cryoconitis]MBB5637587.1 hypothetical protein [Pedobacter cryoconitis]MBB6270014.1 hypothetical protein [Pedobacter cryoconitis]
MKTFRNLMLLTLVASLLSSCIVQDRGGYGYRRHYHDGYWRRGY